MNVMAELGHFCRHYRAGGNLDSRFILLSESQRL